MRRMSRIGGAVLLGAWLSWSTIALASNPSVQAEWSCKDNCKKELQECTDACEKYAREGASVCIQACSKLHVECVDECKPSKKDKKESGHE